MDAKHRHELKQNELEELLKHLPDLLRRYVWQIVGVILIIIAMVLFLFRGHIRAIPERMAVAACAERTNVVQNYQAEKMAAFESVFSQDQSLEGQDLAVVAERLGTAASEAGGGDASALFYIKQGDAYRSSLYYRDEMMDRETVIQRAEQAREAYEKAQDEAQSPVLLAGAKFGQGLCAEEIGDLTRAEDLYREVAETEAYADTFYREQAKMRLMILKDLGNEVVFVEPVTEAAPMPTPMGSDLDITLPEGLPQTPDLGGAAEPDAGLDLELEGGAREASEPDSP